ncbi:Beta-catenin-like protein 1 [Schistosoma japonicum]|nr:Beta-catenin-like protein 1 [Schistosoma japonicum]
MHKLLESTCLQEAGLGKVNKFLEVLFSDETKKDEANGVHKTLGIVESLLEIRPDMNLYVSELLSMLLKMDETNRRQLDEVDGIDILLHQLSVYKRRDPGNQEEIELMRNLFNCLCSSLMLPENKDRFLKGEGIQLMNLMLRQFMISLNDDRAILRIVIYKLVMYRFVYLSMWIALCIRVIEQYPGE